MTEHKKTRPGTMPPEFLEWLPAVAASMRRMRTPIDCTAAGWALASVMLEELAEGRDPRSRFDSGKSKKVRDMAAEAVLARISAGATKTAAIKDVAAASGRDDKTIRRHLREYGREIWPNGVTWTRPDGSRDVD